MSARQRDRRRRCSRGRVRGHGGRAAARRAWREADAGRARREACSRASGAETNRLQTWTPMGVRQLEVRAARRTLRAFVLLRELRQADAAQVTVSTREVCIALALEAYLRGGSSASECIAE